MKRITRPHRLYLAASVLSIASLAEAQTSVTWSYAGNGSWSVASNWTGGVVPNDGVPSGSSYYVFIDGAQVPNVAVNINSGQSYKVTQLSISSGDRLNINASGALALASDGTISNSGTIVIGGVGTLNCSASTVTLSGGGTITISNSRLAGAGNLYNVDNRIIGSGSFGINAGGLVNAGTITITGSSIMDPSPAAGCINSGQVDVSAGTLALTGNGGGGFDNSGGSITVQNGATLSILSGAFIAGGTLATFGTGIITVPTASSGTFEGVSNLGNITALNGTNTYLAGTILNSGSINISPTTSNTDLEIPVATTLNGTGTLSLNSANATVVGGGTLTNSSTHTIRGYGSLGGNVVSFINNGKIMADVSGGTLILDPDSVANACVNNGLMQASNGGILSITGNGGGDVINSGTIEALNASTILVSSGAMITGGTLVTSGTGIIVVPAAGDATFAGVSNAGRVNSLNGSNTYLVGSILNNGSISVTPTASNTDLEIPTDTILNGTGTLNLNSSLVTVVGGGTLTNSSTHTIRGVGNLGVNAIAFHNNGLVTADVPAGTLTIDPTPGVNTCTNTGTMQAQYGGILFFSGNGGGSVINTGRIEALHGSMISVSSNATISGGTLATFGTGVIVVPASGDATFDGVTNLGYINALNATNTYLVGSIVNNGSISVTPTTSNTDVEILGATTLSGSGVLLLNSSLVTVVGAGTLTNASTHTISGIGNLGGNVIALINQGMILQETGGGTLVIDPSLLGGMLNTGRIRVRSGGTIDLSGNGGGSFSGPGSYETDSALATLRLSNSAIVSGGSIANDGNLLMAGDTLDVSGISGTGATSLTLGSISAGYIRQGTLSISTARTAAVKPGGTIASTSKVNALALTGTAKLDLNDNALVLDYTGVSPLATVRSQITTGYNNGSWNGSGINSTAASSDKTRALGYAEASSVGVTSSFRGQSFAGGDAVLVMYTLRGDTNLDRKVDSTDFNALAPNYGIKDGSALWIQGDFDYNGKVNTIDFNWLAGNFGQTLPAGAEQPGPLLGAIVPEPALLSLISASLFVRRRIRR